MPGKYLDKTGLSHLVDKIKLLITNAFNNLKSEISDNYVKNVGNESINGSLQITNNSNVATSKLNQNGNIEATQKVTIKSDSNNFGALTFASANRTGDFIKLYGGSDAYGDGVVIGNGGLVIVGSGESSINLYDTLVTNGSWTVSNEDLVLGSDGLIQFYTNCNTVESRHSILMDASGNVVIPPENNTSGGHFYAQHSTFEVDQANNGVSSTTWPGGISITDKDRRRTGFFCNGVYSNGAITTGIYAYNYNTSGVQSGSCSLQVGVNQDGSVYYSLTDSSAFRKALGLGTSTGAFPLTISQGGTNATTAANARTQLGLGTVVKTATITTGTYTGDGVQLAANAKGTVSISGTAGAGTFCGIVNMYTSHNTVVGITGCNGTSVYVINMTSTARDASYYSVTVTRKYLNVTNV